MVKVVYTNSAPSLGAQQLNSPHLLSLMADMTLQTGADQSSTVLWVE